MLKFRSFYEAIALLTLLMAGGTVSSAEGQDCNRADELYNQSLENKDQQEGLLQSALEVCPAHLQALNNLGVIRERQNRLQEAEVLYRRAIEIQPSFAASYAGLGDVLFAREKYREAESSYRTLLDILNGDRINGINNPFARHEAAYRSKLQNVQSRLNTESIVSAAEIGELLGAPKVTRRNSRGIRVETHLPQADFRSITFQTNSDRLTDQGWRQVEQIAIALQKDNLRTASIKIEGHTDSDGSPEYNQTLSAQRADSVRKALHERYSIDSKRLQVAGFGETRPIANNGSEKGKALNRRVTLVNVQP